MTSEQYDGVDPIGEETLRAITKADKFNLWMYQAIKPHVKGRVLEIGSGVGNISQHLLLDGFTVTLSDLRQNYVEILQQKFSKQKNLAAVKKVNLTHPEFEIHYRDLLGQFDSVVALNVIEHIEDDSLAMRNVAKLLAPNGQSVILVPAFQWLYNDIDTGLEHFRRYTLNGICQVIENSGFNISARKYFNFIGIFAWFTSGVILRKKVISEGQTGLFNLLVPIFRFFDHLVFRKIGLSAIAIGLKQ